MVERSMKREVVLGGSWGCWACHTFSRQRFYRCCPHADPVGGGHSHILKDGGEEREGRVGAVGGWELWGLVCFPLAVVFWVSDDALKLPPCGGCSNLLKDGEGKLVTVPGGDRGLLGQLASPRQWSSVCWMMSPGLYSAGVASIP